MPRLRACSSGYLDSSGAEATRAGWPGKLGADPRQRCDGGVKLSSSPACAQLREAFGAVAAAGVALGELPLEGWRRRLRIIAGRQDRRLFYELTDLQATAADVLAKLDGCPAQGVPFTAADRSPRRFASRRALIRPGDEHAVPWLRRESWRARICNRLAGAWL